MRFLLLFCILFGLQLNAQKNYTDYYTLINKAEERFVLSADSSCFALYDRAFELNQPFLKDPFIASQIAYYLGDTAKCLSYLQVCFEEGMPSIVLNASPLFNKFLSKQLREEIQQLFKRHYQPKKVNINLNNQLCLWCYQSDSIKVKIGGRTKAFHDNEERARQFILDSLLHFGKFPNEHLVGISTDELQREFYANFDRESVYDETEILLGHVPVEYELRRKCPYNIILHSKCFFVENEPLFFEAMLNGYLHPKEYAILEETSILWHKNDGNPHETCTNSPRICYNIFGNSPISSIHLYTTTVEGLQEVEANRARIYLQKFSIDKAKKQIEEEVGIKFFFDFTGR